jgi:hypothetical protein
MNFRILSAGASAAIVMAIGPGILPGQASGAKPAGKKWIPGKTADGQPDISGIWTNVTLTPLERPRDLGDKPFFTAEEARVYAAKLVDQGNADRRNPNPLQDVGTAYNAFWYDRGTSMVPTLRTSLIVDPPDGRMPALTPEAQERQAARLAERQRMGPADGPESRSLAERCLLWATAGPPMMPSFYNNNYQIVQGPGYVAILVEMIHDVRIIPLDGRPHLPAGIRQWMGDPRGHWEGDTLIVETTNFTDRTGFRGTTENLRLTERFTRVAPGQLMYEFTVDDPLTFTRPWKAEIPMLQSDGAMYEYACHEGNYAMTDMLAGARMEERKAADAAKVSK